LIGIFVAAAVVVAGGGLVLWLARACFRGTLPRQWLLGYRTPLTMRNRDAWVVVNRAAAPLIAVGGGGGILAGLVAMILAAVDRVDIAPGVLGGGLVWVILWLVLGVFPAAIAARKYR
jgi:hypothetical protein